MPSLAIHPRHKREVQDGKNQRTGIKRTHAARELAVRGIGVVQTADANPCDQGADSKQDGAHVVSQSASDIEYQQS